MDGLLQFSILREPLIKLCNCLFQELGDGWAPAVLNTQREADFIGQATRTLSSGSRRFLLGGSATGIDGQLIPFMEYRTGNSGSLVAIFYLCNIWCVEESQLYKYYILIIIYKVLSFVKVAHQKHGLNRIF